MELSTQAKSLYNEFPNLSESDIRSIDNKIKKKIDTMSNTKEYMEISKFIQDEVSNLYKNKQSINAKKIKKKANRLALMYIENSRVFSLQESWYALLAFFIAIANMIQRIVNFDIKKNDKLSFHIYFFTMIIWLLIVTSKKMMGNNVKCFVDIFNRASSSMAVISLNAFYLAILMTDCIAVWIIIIIVSVIITVGLAIADYVKLRKFGMLPLTMI